MTHDFLLFFMGVLVCAAVVIVGSVSAAIVEWHGERPEPKRKLTLRRRLSEWWGPWVLH